MPFNLNPQEPQGLGIVPAIGAMKNNIPPIFKYVLGAIGAVGGYSYGIHQERFSVALCTGIGLVVGLCLIELVSHLTEFLIGAVIVAAAAVAMWLLLSHDAELKSHHQSAPVQRSSPSDGKAMRQFPRTVQGVNL